MSFLKTLVLFFPLSAAGQIGGVSGSKISANCVDVVNDRTLEFEPALNFSGTREAWDGKGKLNPLFAGGDSLHRSTELAFRLTYGLWDVLEVGATVNTGLESVDLGAKFVLLENDSYGLAGLAGASLPLGNGSYDRSVSTETNTPRLGLGCIGSVSFSKRLEFDVHAQVCRFIQETDLRHQNAWYFNMDGGYFVFDRQLQLIVGMGYERHAYTVLSQASRFTLYPGISVETGKNYILVLSAPFDLAGRNMEKSAGINLALTLTID